MFKLVVHKAIAGLEGVKAFVTNACFHIENGDVSCLLVRQCLLSFGVASVVC